VLLWLDYCNSVLAGLPASTLAPIQRLLHVAARLVNDLKASDHVTSALVDLHWWIKQRVCSRVPPEYLLTCKIHVKYLFPADYLLTSKIHIKCMFPAEYLLTCKIHVKCMFPAEYLLTCKIHVKYLFPAEYLLTCKIKGSDELINYLPLLHEACGGDQG